MGWSGTTVMVHGLSVDVTNDLQLDNVLDSSVHFVVNSYVCTIVDIGAIPPGVIFPYAGVMVFNGWLICDGTSYLRTDYPLLFRVIGARYGSADGTHFNVPDLRGRHVLGVDSGHALALAGGFIDHDHTGSNPHPDHAVTQAAAHATGADASSVGGVAKVIDGVHTGMAVDAHSLHGRTGKNNPPFLALNHIIKT
jgi:microcystin-dependent protein